MADTAAAVMLMARFGSPSFGGAQNVTNALRRAEAGRHFPCGSCSRSRKPLRVIRSLAEWRSHCAGVETCLDDRFGVLAPNKYLEEKINTAILSEEEMADSASPELMNIRRKQRAASSRVREKLDSMIRSPPIRSCCRTRSSPSGVDASSFRSGRAPGRGPGLVHDTSASGATVFVEPMAVVEANNELRFLLSREEAEIERILAELSAETGSFAGGIIADYGILVELNLILPKGGSLTR